MVQTILENVNRLGVDNFLRKVVSVTYSVAEDIFSAIQSASVDC